MSRNLSNLFLRPKLDKAASGFSPAAKAAAIIMCANDLPSFLAPLPSPYLILSVAQMEDECRGFVELGYVGRYTSILRAKMNPRQYHFYYAKSAYFTNI